MNVYETTASPDIVCKALRDVVGLDFDATDSSEVSAAAVLISKLSENAEIADELADSIARHSRPMLLDQASLANQYRHVLLRTVQAQTLADDPLQDDHPSESTAEASLRQASLASAKRHDDTPAELKIWADVHAIDKAFVTISPEKLGFHPGSTCIEWSSEVGGDGNGFCAQLKLRSPAIPIF